MGHAQEHHGLYRGDDSFFLGERAPQHLSFSPLAWALFPITDTLLATPVYFLFGPVAAAGFWVGTIFYLVAYEYLHYRMHVPAGGWLESLAPMRWNRTRHLLHHHKHFTNMNVVIPIADLVLGTIRTARSVDAPPRTVVAKRESEAVSSAL